MQTQSSNVHAHGSHPRVRFRYGFWPLLVYPTVQSLSLHGLMKKRGLMEARGVERGDYIHLDGEETMEGHRQRT